MIKAKDNSDVTVESEWYFSNHNSCNASSMGSLYKVTKINHDEISFRGISGYHSGDNFNDWGSHERFLNKFVPYKGIDHARLSRLKVIIGQVLSGSNRDELYNLLMELDI